MVPKFRGNLEDWLDQNDSKNKSRSGSKKKKPTLARATALPLEKANATVAEVFQNQCRVRLDQQEVELLCSYRRANVVGKSNDFRERTPVAVGDRVLANETQPKVGVIEGVCVRKKTFSRLAPGRDVGQHQHILAANVDLVVIVGSALEPVFSPFWIDRLIVAATSEQIEVLLCITKIDLWQGSEPSPWKLYHDLGYSVAEVCAKQGLGIPALMSHLLKKTVVFCGQSRVGKTSLLRVLTGREVGKIGSVNESSGQGRHTTTSAVLLTAPEQSQWIDTPGMREFDLVKLTPMELVQCFPEFKNLNCAKKDCQHAEEPGCQASELPRYTSYRKILESIREKTNAQKFPWK